MPLTPQKMGSIQLRRLSPLLSPSRTICTTMPASCFLRPPYRINNNPAGPRRRGYRSLARPFKTIAKKEAFLFLFDARASRSDVSEGDTGAGSPNELDEMKLTPGPRRTADGCVSPYLHGVGRALSSTVALWKEGLEATRRRGIPLGTRSLQREDTHVCTHHTLHRHARTGVIFKGQSQT